jgi:hypothetical protein
MIDDQEIVDLFKRCRDHADYLDDVGFDGDGEDIRELLQYTELQDGMICSLRASLAMIQSRFLELNADGTIKEEDDEA